MIDFLVIKKRQDGDGIIFIDSFVKRKGAVTAEFIHGGDEYFIADNTPERILEYIIHNTVAGKTKFITVHIGSRTSVEAEQFLIFKVYLCGNMTFCVTGCAVNVFRIGTDLAGGVSDKCIAAGIRIENSVYHDISSGICRITIDSSAHKRNLCSFKRNIHGGDKTLLIIGTEFNAYGIVLTWSDLTNTVFKRLDVIDRAGRKITDNASLDSGIRSKCDDDQTLIGGFTFIIGDTAGSDTGDPVKLL